MIYVRPWCWPLHIADPVVPTRPVPSSSKPLTKAESKYEHGQTVEFEGTCGPIITLGAGPQGEEETRQQGNVTRQTELQTCQTDCAAATVARSECCRILPSSYSARFGAARSLLKLSVPSSYSRQYKL